MNKILNLVAVALILFAVTVSAQQTYVITNTNSNNNMFSVWLNKNVVNGADGVSSGFALTAIREHAMGLPITIQFGSGDGDTLKSREGGFYFYPPSDSGVVGWGMITLTGSAMLESDIIYIRDMVVVCSANIIARDFATALIVNRSTLTVKSGALSADSGAVLSVSNNSNITIAGGTFVKSAWSSQGSRSAVYITSSQTTITGGTFSSAGVITLEVYNADVTAEPSSVILGGSPKINGAISTNSPGRITIDTTFVLSGTIPLILTEYASRVGAVAIASGAAHIGSFKFDDFPYILTVSGDDIVVAFSEEFIAPRYVIIGGNEVDYRLIKGTEILVPEAANIAEILDFIISDAASLPCTVQFGSGDQVLDIGQGTLFFNGNTIVDNQRWGALTLAGKITSSGNSTQGGPTPTINVTNVTAVYNMADITNTSTAFTVGAVVIREESNFTHISGCISGTVYNFGSGTFTSSGGTIRGIYSGPVQPNVASTVTSGNIILEGGIIGDTTRQFMRGTIIHNSSGELRVSGTTHIFGTGDKDSVDNVIQNRRNGTVRINGGTISHFGTGNTLHNAGIGSITISGNAEISSVNGHSIEIDPEGTVILGGNPTIHGPISMPRLAPDCLKLVTGENAFTPGDKIYELKTTDTVGTNASKVIVSNGAGFVRNFMFTADSAATEKVELAVNGNNIVLTTGTVHIVEFDLNGGTHINGGTTVPASIPVINNGALGELARPSARYVNANNYLSYDKWYTSNGKMEGKWIIGNEFRFGTTVVTNDITLVLDWSDSIFTSVKEIDRVIPGPDINEDASVIIPVTVTAGEFTVGPNPVDRQSGVVNIFRIGRRITDGTLTIYDATGNFVKKINISDKSANDVGKRLVGSWDLTDVLERTVPGGTYLVRGVVTTVSGSRERVSVIIGVR